ncbi:MAG: ATP-binding cassette domain-containing protein, partial [Clostridia bacterium]|nr:ATP-binding cassette domain-containing protein [Clostridia bacterium]
MSFLEVSGLKKHFGKAQVLNGIDFSLEKGEVLAIIGSSGGGKTTLLRCLHFLEMAEEALSYFSLTYFP